MNHLTLFPSLAKKVFFALLLMPLLALTALAQTHPRLFFDAADVPDLRAKALSAPHSEMLAQMIVNINSRDYNQRGGNFAAAYLLTGDETYAEMAALRALDYISNTDRWENNSAWGLRRGIDTVAVAQLYDFCYNSTTWANMTVPATVSPVTFTVDGVSVPIPGSPDGLSPDEKWVTSYTARTVTVPAKYVGLPLREAISQALKNNADSLMDSGGGAWPGNDKIGNNWHAVRYAGAGLGYLASDEDDAGRLEDAISRLKTHISGNLSDSPLAMGWNPEGISYAQFPGWYTYPFTIALKRIEGRDLVAEHPVMRYALWSSYMGAMPIQRTSRLGEGLGVKPDFDDDHNVWEGEGTAALAFAFAYNDDPNDAIPDFDYRPGLKFMYRRLTGDLGDQQWDSASGNGIYSFLYYPDAMAEQNPKDVWGLTYYDPAYGAVMFRNQYEDADYSPFSGGVFTTQPRDIVFQTTANLRDDLGGHDGPDDMTFRILGFGVPWAVGSGRIWDLRGQTNLSPFDPESFGPGDQGIVRWGNEIRDIFLRDNTGDGYVVMHMDTSPTGLRNQTRRMVVDYSGDSGADGLFIISDSCDDQNPWWRQQTIRSNSIDVSTPGQFIITSPEGHRMLGKVLYPPNVTCRTGEFQRGNPYDYRDNSVEDEKWNRWVDFEAGADGEVLVALALVESGQALPTINVAGSPETGFTVSAGSASFSLDGDAISSAAWNPPSITLNTPTDGQAIVAAGGSGSVTVSGTASDSDGTIESVEILLNDVVQNTLSFNAASVNWGPVNLTGLSLGEHTIKAIATDNSGDTRTETARVSVTTSIPPEVALTFPTRSSQVFAGQNLILRGTVSDADNTVSRVEIWGKHITNNPDLQLLGNAVINSSDGTWSYNINNIHIGEHEFYAIAVDATDDETRTETLSLRAGLRYSMADDFYGDAGNFTYMTTLGANGRWSVVDDGGNLALRVLPMSGYNYDQSRTNLQDSRFPNYPDFEIRWRAKPNSELSTENNYFLHFGADVSLDLQPINSIEKPYSWQDVGYGTRIFYRAANGGYTPEIGFTHNMHLKTDAGYPDNPGTDRAGVPGTDWAELTVRRVGTNMKVTVDGVEIIDADHNYIGTRGLLGFGNHRGSGYSFLIDDVQFTPLDSSGDPVNDTKSTLSFTAPLNFSQLEAGTPVSLTGTASDPDGIATLTLYRGARHVADLTPDGSGNWSWNWSTPLLGRYAFHLEATDTRGFTTRSAPFALTVAAEAAAPSNAAPTITLERDLTHTEALRLTGTAADPEDELAGIQIFRDGLLVGNGNLSGGSWTFDIGAPPVGTQTYTARVFDQSGLSGDSGDLSVNLTAPEIALDTLPSNGTFTVGLPNPLTATVTAGSESIRGVTFYANGIEIGAGSLLGGKWTLSWTPRFYGDYEITATVTDAVGIERTTASASSTVVADASSIGATVAYAGAEQFLDVMELSDGSLLMAGTATDLSWLPQGTPSTTLSLPVDFPNETTDRSAFLLHISGDMQSIQHLYQIPHGRVHNLRWIKTTSKPGEATGSLYVSGSSNASGQEYFIAKLDGNIVNSTLSAVSWVTDATVTGVNEDLQAWDVDGSGNLAFVDQTDLGDGFDRLYLRFLDGNGQARVLPNLRGTYFDGSSNLTPTAPALTPPSGADASVLLFGRDLTSSVTTDPESGLVTSGLDENNDGTPDYLELWPDGNGSLRQGLWPQDIFLPLQSYGGFTYGYNGYRSAGSIRIGGLTYDRDTGDFYVGYNNQSKFWSFSLDGDTPDFEPALIAYSATGSMKWWSRLYSEVVDKDEDGEIDPMTYAELAALGLEDPQYEGEPQPCPPDQYVDGVAIDYSTSPATIVVNGRCHGNAPNNFWSGNEISARPGAEGFHNQFTGTEGNIHISWIGKLKESTAVAGGVTKPVGELQAASWIGGYFRDRAQTQAPYPEPIHDNWPSHNAGWSDLTTTRLEPGSIQVDSSGRVYLVGVGPRMVTSFNAYQKIPRHTDSLNEGIAPWHNFVRVLSPDLSTLVYSSALTGAWTADSLTEQPVGANNTSLRGVFPTSNGVLTVGSHLADGSNNALGNPVPVNKVPAWGTSVASGESALMARLPFATSANIAPAVALTQPAASLGLPPGNSITLAATASDADGSIVRVEFYANGNKIHEDNTAPYSYDWTPGGAEGTTYTLLAQAIDDDDSATLSDSIELKLENVPTVALTAPADGSVAAINKTKTITATASDIAPGYVVRVEFLVDGDVVGSDNTAPYSYDWVPSSLGNHILTARAIDNTGGEGITVDARTIDVIEGNIAPNISLLSPASGMLRSASDPLLLRASASDESGIDRVTFYVNGIAVGDGTPGSGDHYELQWPPTLSGSITVSATVFDNGEPDNDVLSRSSETISMTLATSAAPSTPGSLSTSILSWNRIQLDWTHSASNESGYEIQRKIGGGTWQSIVTLEANSSTYTDTGLLASTSYDYRIRALNSLGESDWSTTAAATTPNRPGVDYTWNNASGNATWDFSSANFTTGSGNIAWANEVDLHSADFDAQTGPITLNEDIELYAIKNARDDIDGTGSILLGAGGLSVDTQYSRLDIVPITLVGSQTWTMFSEGITSELTSTIDTVLRLEGRGAVRPEGNQWANFLGTLQIVPTSGRLIKVETNAFTTPAAFELIDSDGYANTSTRAGLYMDSSYNVGGVGGNGEIFANRGRAITLTLDVPLSRNIDFSGRLYESDRSKGEGLKVVKRGLGSQTFSGAIDYWKETEIEAGSLIINGTKTAAGPIHVHSGATLLGAGTAAGDITVQSGGRIDAGATAESIGTLSHNDHLILEAGSEVHWQHLDSSSDLIDIEGDLTLPSGTVHLKLKKLGSNDPAQSDVIPLINVTGTVQNFAQTTWNVDLSETPWSTAQVVENAGGIALTGIRVRSFANWIEDEYPSIPLADREPDGNPDGDAYVNIVEYLHGFDPDDSNNLISEPIQLNITGAENTVMRYRLNKQARELNYIIEYSSDLINWTPSTLPRVTVNDHGESEDVEVLIPVSPGATSVFVRIRIP